MLYALCNKGFNELLNKGFNELLNKGFNELLNKGINELLNKGFNKCLIQPVLFVLNALFTTRYSNMFQVL
jgi:hypothetical protein